MDVLIYELEAGDSLAPEMLEPIAPTIGSPVAAPMPRWWCWVI